MHALTDTGDPESDLPISQKAVQSIGLRGKRAEKFSGAIFSESRRYLRYLTDQETLNRSFRAGYMEQLIDSEQTGTEIWWKISKRPEIVELLAKCWLLPRRQEVYAVLTDTRP